MRAIVKKVGGTSLADAAQFLKVINIVKNDPSCKHVVVSAPGARFPGDTKVTDLLYKLYTGDTVVAEQALRDIQDRYQEITTVLSLSIDTASLLRDLLRNRASLTLDYVVSRGEYLSAKILAVALGPGYYFSDAADFITFNALGEVDMDATGRKFSNLDTAPIYGVVIPGFYGAQCGHIKILGRGGSDLTGAIVAALIQADRYENWKDTTLRMAHPGIVPGAKKIDTITYAELRELTYSGVEAFHPEAVFPLRELRIPIELKNTNDPEEQGTLIVPDDQALSRTRGSITGVAGRKDFTFIRIEKALMNREIGFLRKVCSAFEREGVSIEHIATTVDTVSVIVVSERLNGKQESVVQEITHECRPDKVLVEHELALVCTVGHAMAHTPGVAAHLFAAVAGAGVNVRVIEQGSSELSIIIGVRNETLETAIRAIYNAFAG